MTRRQAPPPHTRTPSPAVQRHSHRRAPHAHRHRRHRRRQPTPTPRGLRILQRPPPASTDASTSNPHAPTTRPRPPPRRQHQSSKHMLHLSDFMQPQVPVRNKRKPVRILQKPREKPLETHSTMTIAQHIRNKIDGDEFEHQSSKLPQNAWSRRHSISTLYDMVFEESASSTEEEKTESNLMKEQKADLVSTDEQKIIPLHLTEKQAKRSVKAKAMYKDLANGQTVLIVREIQEKVKSKKRGPMKRALIKDFCRQIIVNLVDAVCEQQPSPPIETLYLQLPTVNDEVRSYILNLLTTLVEDNARYREKSKLMKKKKKAPRVFYLCGLREVRQHCMKTSKVKLVILATNLEEAKEDHGPSTYVRDILEACSDRSIPFAAPYSRRRLGKIMKKRGKISAVALLDVSGRIDLYREVLSHLN